jgi:hypothetical protein
MPEKIPPLPQTPIGIGNEKRIFDHPQNPEKVIGEYRELLTPEEVKAIYYFAKLVDILFPGNYVTVSQAGVDKQSGKSMFIAEKIVLSEEAQRVADYGVTDEQYLMGDESSVYTDVERAIIESVETEITTDPNVREVSTAMKLAGLPIDTVSAGNFSVSSDGSVHYLDVMQPFVVADSGVTLRCNTKKLYEAVAEVEDTEMRERATFYLGKTLDLYADATEKWRAGQTHIK